jgi:hypothetical protein
MKPVDQLTDDELVGRMRQAMREMPDAPAAWQQAAISLWPSAAATFSAQAALTAKAFVRLVAATLTFDSWAASSFAHGMRSTRNPTRHLMFSADGRDIDLRVTPRAEHFTVSGQVLGPDESGRVELTTLSAPNAACHTAQLDPLSEFRIDGVAAGRYVLTLHTGADPIVVQPIDVGEPSP